MTSNIAQLDTSLDVPPPSAAGAPWPAIMRPGDAVIGADEQPWVDMAGYAGSAIKVLYADRASQMFVFLYRLG